MGQTLTHGIYLPDEGERNCYNGLAGNWQLLDGAVGTVAAHTTQIAGKAASNHVHGNITNDGKVGTAANKPLITGTGGVVQAGSFGNSANTFCEGNDSRLSDARTPVAHTHTKSDITDLLNSDFIPSANNSYDLGSSSYQWNNLYAKNYFYNGVAWGLDKANEWTGNNTFTANSYNNNVIMNNRTLDLSQGNPAVSETNQCMILFMDGTKTRDYARFQSWAATGETVAVIGSTYRPDANTETDFSVWVSNRNNDTTFHPYGVANPNLGNSTFKWKTLNGINPGALSLPKTASSNLDTTNWNLRGGLICSFIPSADGFINVQIKRNVDFSVWAISAGRQNFRATLMADGSYVVMVWFPCRAGIKFEIYSVPLIDSPAEQREDDLIIQVAKIWQSEGNV